MPKKSAYTGTQKKAIKQGAHEYRKGGKYREQSSRIFQGYAPGHHKYKSTEGKLKSTLKGYEKYKSGEGSPYKDLMGFAPGGENYENIHPLQHERLGDIGNKYGRAYEMAQKGFDPLVQQAYQRFDREVAPGIANTYGSSAGAGSSALNQALAGARKDLELGLAAQLAPMQSQIAQNLLGQHLGGKERAMFGNLEEQQRQQRMQYGAAADIFNAQRGADFGYMQDRRNDVSYMNQIGLGTAQQLANSGIPGMQGGFISPYLQQSNQGNPSFGSRIGSSVLGGIGGGIGGLLAGGPAGAAVGSVSGGIQGLGYGGAQPGFY